MLVRPRLMDGGWFNDRSGSLEGAQPLLLCKQVQAGKRNVPGTYVLYTLTSDLLKAEIISAFDRSERAGSDTPATCGGAPPALLPLSANGS